MSNTIETPKYRFDTQKVRAGYDPTEHHYAVSPPIYQTAAFELESVEYTRELVGLPRSRVYLYPAGQSHNSGA